MPIHKIVMLFVGLSFLLGDPIHSQDIEATNSAGAAAEPANAQDANPEEAAVRQAIASYVDAFNQRNAERLAAHWSPDGVYISRDSGEQVVGRAAMIQEFSTMLQGEDLPQLGVVTESLQFVSPNVALERGVATVTQPDGSVDRTDYSVVFIKRDGQWLIDRVTEATKVEEEPEPSHYEHLKGLDWMVGEWVDEEDEFTITTVCRWTRNQNYLSRMYQVEVDGEVTSSGMQIIGWDPQKKQIRSWLFDSAGVFVQGTWSQKKDRWIVASVAVLADGGSGSFTAIFRPIDEQRFGWQKVNQIVDGELLPNLDEVIVSRVQ